MVNSFVFLDDDDLLTRSALGHLQRALQKSSNAIAAVGARVYFNENGHSWRSPHPRWGFTKRVWNDVLFGWAPVCGQTLFRKSQVAKVGGWNPTLSIAEDHELWMKFSLEHPVVILPEPVLKARVHAGQTNFAGFGKKQVNQIKLGVLAKLDAETQARGRGLHEAYRRCRIAQKAFQRRRYKTSLACYLSAARRAPGQIWSPLTGLEFLVGFAKSALCAVQPVQFTSLARRLNQRLRSARQRSQVVASPQKNQPPRADLDTFSIPVTNENS